ncbi:unnamed protein product [Phytomonas sp. Hart1]|nr:unnamed protein product [Phytomonas sp. Hart1]|eukprot:CCW69454.1 unnamed protein product [Phytomonas sp. isolate Hart1]
MDSEELSALRTELLRQKVVFAAELRRQREEFEERLDGIAQVLAERDADCRNLQAVVTILGKKLDLFSKQLNEQKARGTPLRRTPSNCRPSLNYLLESSRPGTGKKNTERVLPMSEESHRMHPNPSSTNPPDLLRLNLVSSLKSLSRASSPFSEYHSRADSGVGVLSARGVNPNRSLIRASTKTPSLRNEPTRSAEKKELGGSNSDLHPNRSSTRRKNGLLSLRTPKGSMKL